jgi:hypothetical protein
MQLETRTMKLLQIAMTTVATLMVGSSAALATPCPMTYGNFQVAIPHVDVENCPAELAGKERFCRASIASDQVHVYAFDGEGDKCLLAMKSYEEGQFKIEFKAADKPAAKPAK